MKSLNERLAFRDKQRQREDKERGSNPHAQVTGGDKDEKEALKANPVPEGDEKGQLVNEVSGKKASDFAPKQGANNPQTPEDEFDATEYVNDNVDNIRNDLKNIGSDELKKVADAETAGKKRASVLDAVAAEQKRREAAGASWGANK